MKTTNRSGKSTKNALVKKSMVFLRGNYSLANIENNNRDYFLYRLLGGWRGGWIGNWGIGNTEQICIPLRIKECIIKHSIKFIIDAKRSGDIVSYSLWSTHKSLWGTDLQKASRWSISFRFFGIFWTIFLQENWFRFFGYIRNALLIEFRLKFSASFLMKKATPPNCFIHKIKSAKGKRFYSICYFTKAYIKFVHNLL